MGHGTWQYEISVITVDEKKRFRVAEIWVLHGSLYATLSIRIDKYRLISQKYPIHVEFEFS